MERKQKPVRALFYLNVTSTASETAETKERQGTDLNHFHILAFKTFGRHINACLQFAWHFSLSNAAVKSLTYIFCTTLVKGDLYATVSFTCPISIAWCSTVNGLSK